MRKFVAYFRLITDRQGQSGLGLAGQRAAVLDCLRASEELVADYTEIETGKKDSLENRPELRRALKHAKRSGATLIVAKFDRLTRSVVVTSMLHTANVDFICCDNPHANRLTIQILAAVAEDEAHRISERTKAALRAYKAKGGILGASRPESRNLTPEGRRRGSAASLDVRRRSTADLYDGLSDELQALRFAGHSLRSIAKRINESGLMTRRGRPWGPSQVSRILANAQTKMRCDVGCIRT